MNGSRMYILIFILSCFAVSQPDLLCQNINAVNERDVKLSGNYYWGEGISDSLAQAKSDAVSSLQYNISVTLRSASESSVSETGDEIASSFSRNVKMFSTIKLKGLNFLEKNLPDGRIRSIAFISKENFEALMAEIAGDVTNMAKIGEETERRQGFVQAIPSYYKAYLTTYLSPNSIPFKSETYKQEYSNIRFFLETKIKQYLSEIEIEQKNVEVDPAAEDLFTVYLDVRYLKMDVSNIDLNFDQPGNPRQLVNKGVAKLFLYSQPSSVQQEYDIVLKVHFDGDANLAAIEDEFPIYQKQRIRLDFSKLVKIDFKVSETSTGALQFEPEVKNLSVSTLLWEFDNGVTAKDTRVIQKLNAGEHQVSLTINQLENLKITKLIDQHGNVLKSLAAKKEEKNEGIPRIIKELIKRKTYDTLMEEVIAYKKAGKLIYGIRTTDFINLDNCYGAAIDLKTRTVTGFFSPKYGERTDLLTGEKFSDFRAKFKNMGILWLQLN